MVLKLLLIKFAVNILEYDVGLNTSRICQLLAAALHLICALASDTVFEELTFAPVIPPVVLPRNTAKNPAPVVVIGVIVLIVNTSVS